MNDNKTINGELYKNFICSSASTALAEILTLPTCTIKTNYQTSSNATIREVIKMIYSWGGIKSFYSASLPSIGGQILSTSSKYTIYRYLDSNDEYPIKNKMINGMTSGVLSTLMTHPVDCVKIHWQENNKVWPLLKSEGIKKLYQGYSKSFSKVIVSSSLFYLLYDTIKNKISNPIISSGISAIISTFIMHPLDYLKVRHISGKTLYTGWNPINYYKGLSINMLRIVPHFIITMTSIEYMKKII